MKKFKYADQMVIQILEECKHLHDRKNHDYQGSLNLMPQFGLQGSLIELTRKYQRIFNLVMSGGKTFVKETISDTLKDLIIYSAMMLARIERQDYNEHI